jgi:hypothetical protein
MREADHHDRSVGKDRSRQIGTLFCYIDLHSGDRNGNSGGTMRVSMIFLVVLAFAASVVAFPGPPSAKPLSIYVIDVEGGNATLFVSPSG